MEINQWVIKVNLKEPSYQCDDLEKEYLHSGDSENMHRFRIKFPKPNTQRDQYVSMRYFCCSDGIEDAVALHLYCGKIVYGWVWEKVPTGLGHPVDHVVYNVHELANKFPDAVAFLRQEGILEKTWLQKILAYLISIFAR
ncbi:MAG: hypothetical protein CEN89_473 [Candidatus Berkelbacteria bacterium Licking1014_7]|uniref:Uncharacterized protein n=1 Tax=Candidatus Berkelbacteria bacterium Licking1014_7 TaxID=2017147 RepID=A0A554LIS8_9BACT|nr:MAG: hypothetical protein CEN89_473 [Candidatus Berkelbacteria bacterium Licking1014_7]